MKPLEGKNAVVTGASRGIGRAIALKLARQGANVAVNYNSNREQADEVVRALEAEGVAGVAIQANTGEVADVERLMQEAVDRLGAPLDVVVSNAGIEHFGAFDEVTQEEWDRTFAVNTRGQFFVMQQGAKHMNDGGRIVCTSSISARKPFRRHALYSASKAAVEALALNLALELGPRGITVNAIAPGGVQTDMATAHGRAYTGDFSNRPWSDDERAAFAERLKAFTPMGRGAVPEDIADAVSLLVSNEAHWITGQTLVASGGV